MQALPTSFVPVAVLRCLNGPQVVGNGVRFEAKLQRADRDLGPLVSALHRPSGHMMPAGQACPALAMIPPRVVLIARDGTMISPRIPVDGCGLVQQQVLAALNALPWQTVSVTVWSQPPAG
jgi:hypothetical protein